MLPPCIKRYLHRLYISTKQICYICTKCVNRFPRLSALSIAGRERERDGLPWPPPGSCPGAPKAPQKRPLPSSSCQGEGDAKRYPEPNQVCVDKKTEESLPVVALSPSSWKLIRMAANKPFEACPLTSEYFGIIAQRVVAVLLPVISHDIRVLYTFVDSVSHFLSIVR